MDEYGTTLRRRALVFVAAMPAFPLRSELEAVVAPNSQNVAAFTLDELVREGFLEAVDRGSGELRVRLTEAGRRELEPLELPGEGRPYALNRPGGELELDR